MTMDEAQVVVESIELGINGFGWLCLTLGILFLMGDAILIIRNWWDKRRNKPLLGKVKDPVVGLVILRSDLEQKADEARKVLRDCERMIADIDTELDEIRTENLAFGWREKK